MRCLAKCPGCTFPHNKSVWTQPFQFCTEPLSCPDMVVEKICLGGNKKKLHSLAQRLRSLEKCCILLQRHLYKLAKLLHSLAKILALSRKTSWVQTNSSWWLYSLQFIKRLTQLNEEDKKTKHAILYVLEIWSYCVHASPKYELNGISVFYPLEKHA